MISSGKLDNNFLQSFLRHWSDVQVDRCDKFEEIPDTSAHNDWMQVR